MTEKNSYHNTNKESGVTLAQSEQKAERQEDDVMRYARSLRKPFTAEDAWEAFFRFRNIPLTSVRRAITNLTKDGQLVKTDEMKKGSFGKMIHCYEIKPSPAAWLHIAGSTTSVESALDKHIQMVDELHDTKIMDFGDLMELKKQIP